MLQNSVPNNRGPGVVLVIGDNPIVARVGTGDSQPAAAAEIKRACGLSEAEDLD